MVDDTAATNALLSALEVENGHVVYQAARALGKIYSGNGSNGQKAEVNGALAATVFRYYPRPESLGAAIALAQINGIVDKPTQKRLEENLYPAVTEWVASSPDSLPAPDEQEWPLLLQIFVKSGSSSQRQRARELLAGTKPLGAIDPILELLRGKRSDLSDERWDALAELIGSISGVSMPSDGSREERVSQWRQKWHRTLKTRTGEKFRSYCWRALDESIAAVKREPTEKAKKRVETFQEVLLSQTDAPEQIPEWASETARELLEKPIQMKNQVKQALGDIQPDTAAYQKIASLAQVRSIARKEEGKPVVRMFAEKLITMARQEQNDDVLAMLSTILTQMSGIPCDLSQQKVLDKWLEMFRERYPEALPQNE